MTIFVLSQEYVGKTILLSSPICVCGYQFQSSRRHHLIVVDQKVIALTKTEYQLFQVLAAFPEQVLVYEDLIRKGWSFFCWYSSDASRLRCLQRRISAIRKKLAHADVPLVILTIQRYGYELRARMENGWSY